jgi:protein-S-isoprenylcysteine O-methyltransferase Ste14
MSTYTFTLVFLFLGGITASVVWLVTNHWHKKPSRPHPRTTLLNSFIAVSNFVFSVLVPLPLEPDIPIRAFGLSLFSFGLFFAVWAKFVMKANWGPPGQHDIGKQKELVTRGPFQYSRNPIYLGLILMHFGCAIALKSLGILLVPILYIHLDREIKKEEKLLQRYFGDQFVGYKQKVSRFL